MFQLDNSELCEYLYLLSNSQEKSLNLLYSSILRGVFLEASSELEQRLRYEASLNLRLGVDKFFARYGRIDPRLALDMVKLALDKASETQP